MRSADLRRDGPTDARARTAEMRWTPRRRPSVILVAHNVDEDNGTGRVCAQLLRQAGEDFDFTVVSAVLGDQLRPFVKKWCRVHAPARPFALRFTVFWFMASRVLRRLDDHDVVHSVGAIVSVPVDLAAVHFCSTAYVTSERRLAPRAAPPLRRLNSGLARAVAVAGERWCYRPARLRAFAAVSDGVGAEVSRHFPGIPVHVTPNGVNRDRFRLDPTAREQVRAELGANDQPVAVFVGGDWDRKGLTIALEALSSVRGRGGDLCLWVVGAGDIARFSTLAAELAVADAVSFLGPRDDVERYLAAADMFVLPSAYEAHPLVCIEAAACGLPLVVTRVHGVSEILEDGDAGILVERDAGSVAEALLLLAQDPALRAGMGRRARERSSRYSWRASAETVTDLYRSLLADSEGVAA